MEENNEQQAGSASDASASATSDQATSAGASESTASEAGQGGDSGGEVSASGLLKEIHDEVDTIVGEVESGLHNGVDKLRALLDKVKGYL